MAEIIVELKHANIFQGDNLILQDVNLSIDKGQFVYLVGKTGTAGVKTHDETYLARELRRGVE